jgi:hypothetical protein
VSDQALPEGFIADLLTAAFKMPALAIGLEARSHRVQRAGPAPGLAPALGRQPATELAARLAARLVAQ